FVCFFFQAEDGIRDFHVTGVQTCALPICNRLFVLDVHTEGLPYYFEGSIRPHHLYAKPLILEVVRGMRGEGEEEVVLACTDAGRAKWVESLANDLGIHASFVFKRRDETGR